MAKVTAPLLSIGAAGQIGKSQVYATWKGVKYARRYTIPSNPDTSAQKETRSLFYWLTQIWKLAPATAQLPWTAASKGIPQTNRNIFIGKNVKAMRTQTTTADMIGAPGNGGGLAPTSISVAVAVLVFTVTLGEPVLPDGWTITSGNAWAFPEQNPQSGALYDSFTGTATGSPGTVAVTVATAALHRVFGWFEFTKPNGVICYGPALTATATST